MKREHAAPPAWLIAITGSVSVVSAGGALAVADPWLASPSTPASVVTPAIAPPVPVPAPVPAPLPPPPPPQPVPASVPVKVPCTTASLSFAYASATPPHDALDTLAPVLEAARHDASASIVIDGHADSSGDEIGNLVLSKKRAHHVAALILRAGLPPGRVVERAFGAYMPSLGEDGGPTRRVRVWLRDNQCGEENRP